MKCEDYPCCGHIENGQSFCPDEDGCFDCVLCHKKLPKNAPSCICTTCRDSRANMDPDERDYQDLLDEQREAREGYY